MTNTTLIYNQLRSAGVSHAGALGLMGNWMAESGLEPNRLQGDFASNRNLSRAYTADVTAGRITRAQFARDQKGYGLAQWTYFNFATGEGRKLDLYDFWKQSGKALDDASMQVSFALHELRTQSQYDGLWKLLQTTDSLYAATDKVCRLYEQPYYCNVDARYRYALSLDEHLSAMQSATEQSEAPGAKQKEISAAAQVRTEASSLASEPCFFPYRTVDKTMSGKDVAVLQSILDARGYATETDGTIGKVTDQAIRQFQRDHALAADGVCGPLTWAKILSLEE
ncbi:MAG: peptidoglycan-binding protein [Oscillospiraceae bacterium]|nr:peptidoglycan-binding protein [Oscillospiraceae bacterium]